MHQRFLYTCTSGTQCWATHGWLVTQSGTGFPRKSTEVRQDLTSVAMATNRSCQVTQKYARGSRSQKKKKNAFRRNKLITIHRWHHFDVALFLSYLHSLCKPRAPNNANVTTFPPKTFVGTLNVYDVTFFLSL